MNKRQYQHLIRQAALDSGWLEDAIYENGGMLVSLKNGMKYFYENVPKKVFDAFMSASSKGIFLNKEIKPNYKATKI